MPYVGHWDARLYNLCYRGLAVATDAERPLPVVAVLEVPRRTLPLDLVDPRQGRGREEGTPSHTRQQATQRLPGWIAGTFPQSRHIVITLLLYRNSSFQK
jgi:hypothetical protein